MALSILLDDVAGDAQELYETIVAEVEKWEVPGVKFTTREESRSKGWFSGSEKAAVLGVEDEHHLVLVLAYRYGRSFHVSTRAYWQKLKMAEKERAGKLVFLEEVRSGSFGEMVDRSVRSALVQHLEKRQIAVPPSLNPRDVFYKREAQTVEVEG